MKISSPSSIYFIINYLDSEIIIAEDGLIEDEISLTRLNLYHE